MDDYGYGHSGLSGGITFGVIIATIVGGAWGLYAIIASIFKNAVQNHAATIQAQAQAAVTYAQVRQMDAVTGAMLVTVAQGRALPWLMALVIVIVTGVLIWAIVAHYRLQREMVALMREKGGTDGHASV